MNEQIHEVAVYNEQCVMAGRVCLNPEEKYGNDGNDWRDSHDLLVFKGTEAELRELFAGATGFRSKVGRAVLEYIG